MTAVCHDNELLPVGELREELIASILGVKAALDVLHDDEFDVDPVYDALRDAVRDRVEVLRAEEDPVADTYTLASEIAERLARQGG